MKKEFKVQEISENVDVLEVNGQEYSQRCLKNCNRDRLVGNSNVKPGCSWINHSDAYRRMDR